jgi:hypothetical protein
VLHLARQEQLEVRIDQIVDAPLQSGEARQPAAVLRLARLPTTLHLRESVFVTSSWLQTLASASSCSTRREDKRHCSPPLMLPTIAMGSAGGAFQSPVFA